MPSKPVSISSRKHEEIRKISLRQSFGKKWKKFPHYNRIRDAAEALEMGTFVRESELLCRHRHQLDSPVR